MKKEVICSTCGKTLTGRQIGGHRSAYPDHVIGAPEVPNAPPPPKDDKKDGNQPTGGNVVTVTAPRPASVVFSLGAYKIEVDPKDFFESYLIYLDMKQKLNLQDSFSAVLLDSIGMAWRILLTHPVIEGLEAKEVANGRN